MNLPSVTTSVVSMPAIVNPSQREVIKQLCKGFKRLKGMRNVHLDDKFLYEMGVDHVQVDLENETKRGGPYFLPMSRERISSLSKRPKFSIEFDDEWSESVWDFHHDASIVHTTYKSQILESNDESTWCALDSSPWRFRVYVPTM